MDIKSLFSDLINMTLWNIYSHDHILDSQAHSFIISKQLGCKNKADLIELVKQSKLFSRTRYEITYKNKVIYFTTNEAVVIAYLLKGFTQKQIAEHKETVRSSIYRRTANIRRKMSCHNTRQLIVILKATDFKKSMAM